MYPIIKEYNGIEIVIKEVTYKDTTVCIEFKSTTNELSIELLKNLYLKFQCFSSWHLSMFLSTRYFYLFDFVEDIPKLLNEINEYLETRSKYIVNNIVENEDKQVYVDEVVNEVFK